MNLDAVKAAFAWFDKVCLGHPWLSVPLAFLFLLLLIASLAKTAVQLFKGVLKIWSLGRKCGKIQATVYILGLVFVSVASPRIIRWATMPRPVINEDRKEVLSGDYTLRWTFNDQSNGRTKYVVVVKNDETGEHNEIKTSLPFCRIESQGQLEIYVQAVLPDGSKVKGKKIELALYRDSVERIKAKKQLRVGIHADNSEGLFCYNNGKTGEFDGFDIDLINLIAERLRKQYKLDHLSISTSFIEWPSVIEDPNLFDTDFCIASITITPQRATRVLFSKPYWKTDLGVLINSSQADDLTPKKWTG